MNTNKYKHAVLSPMAWSIGHFRGKATPMCDFYELSGKVLCLFSSEEIKRVP